MRVLVTGGYGFIASELVRQLVARGDKVAVIDPLTYAADESNLSGLEGKFEHFLCGVEDDSARGVIAHFKPDVIFHAAAESHVDRSINSYRAFVDTNIVGTFNLLEGARALDPQPLFVYVSTDEVYGSLSEGRATEGSHLNPGNPYSVSKAAAEHTVIAANHTWGQPYIIARSCNNFGPQQHPEKLIPSAITAYLDNRLPQIHGDGSNVREWIHVRDNVAALLLIADHGVPGQIYNITTGVSLSNNEVCNLIAMALGIDSPKVLYTPNRPGNDLRYAMTAAKLKLLGWQPQETFESGLKDTIAWYEKSKMWWSRKLTKPSSPAASPSQPKPSA